MMNVLITNASRQGSFVQAFLAALAPRSTEPQFADGLGADHRVALLSCSTSAAAGKYQV